MSLDGGRSNGLTLIDRSGTAGASSTQVCPANPFRQYFFIENLDATNAIYINFTSAATAGAGSIKIAAGGGAFVMESGTISGEAIYVIAAAGTPAYTAKEG